MTAAAALLLYPSWAVAVVCGATAVRLGRSTGGGLLALCALLALWVTALILVELPATAELAEHVVPAGMLLAGGFVHAGANITGRSPRAAWLGYAWGGAVAILGAIAPRALYGPGLVGAGPWFWPIAVVSGAGAIAVVAWTAREAWRRAGAARWQMAMLCAGNLLGIASGGGAILLRVIGVVHDLRATGPLLLASMIVIGAAVLRGESGRARRMVGQGLVYVAIAATISAVGVSALYVALPALSPGPALAWTVFVAFAASLPLDALRLLAVDAIGRRVFARPIGPRDLADEAARAEVRADHAARLAEIGALVSAVAHEIRNPLGVIAAHAKLLERAGASEASVAALRAQVDRARRFVDDLLDYGKPRPLDIREVELGAVADEAARLVRAAHPAAAAIAIDVPAGAHADADRAGLLDVLVILLGNAAIASGDRPGAAIAITAATTPDAIAVAVTDTGPGVPAAIEATLFTPFVSGRGRDHAHPGTGLGLAIARGIAERHGGALHHERPAEGGARFVLTLPRGGRAP